MPIVAYGCDYAFSHPTIASLKTHQPPLTFACRYLYPMSQNPGTKNLTRAEADQLNTALEHGVVSNYESWASRALDGHDAGVDDARNAQAQHTACGGRMDRPIYASVDFDPTSDQYAAIRAYFIGFASVLGVNRTGAYGGYPVIKFLFDNGLIKWGWQTYAWSGGRYDERCQLSQDKNGVPLGGAEIDLDSAHAEDFGQWNYNPGEEDMPLTDAEIAKIADAVWKLKITPNATATQHLVAARNASDQALDRVGGTSDFPQVLYWGDDKHPDSLTGLGKQLDAIMAAVKAIAGIELTPEQIAELGALIAKVATPNYGGHVVLEPMPPPA